MKPRRLQRATDRERSLNQRQGQCTEKSQQRPSRATKKIRHSSFKLAIPETSARNDQFQDVEHKLREPVGKILVTTSQQDHTCAGCKQPIRDRYLLNACNKFWHDKCLKCDRCQARLGELGPTLYEKGNMNLCRQDYYEMFGQRAICSICDKLIYASEMVMRAKENVYHLECFACQLCGLRFCVGDRFHLFENKIVCQYDYDEHILPIQESLQLSQQQQTQLDPNTGHTRIGMMASEFGSSCEKVDPSSNDPPSPDLLGHIKPSDTRVDNSAPMRFGLATSSDDAALEETRSLGSSAEKRNAHEPTGELLDKLDEASTKTHFANHDDDEPLVEESNQLKNSILAQ